MIGNFTVKHLRHFVLAIFLSRKKYQSRNFTQITRINLVKPYRKVSKSHTFRSDRREQKRCWAQLRLKKGWQHSVGQFSFRHLNGFLVCSVCMCACVSYENFSTSNFESFDFRYVFYPRFFIKCLKCAKQRQFRWIGIFLGISAIGIDTCTAQHTKLR